ncbi:MAG TPA: di-heme oxidoredictase family protein, partial [bacterium]
MSIKRAWILLAILSSSACSDLLTDAPDETTIFDGPIEGLTLAQLNAFFHGDEAFSEVFNVNTGLGPIFNNTACVNCHPADGRAHPSTNLVRFGRDNGGVFDYMLELGGPQLQNRSIPGYPAEAFPVDATGRSERGGP